MPNTHDSRPIGVFDSGIGGLTSVRVLFRILPHESVLYFGDTARVPYGSKSQDTVTRFSFEIARFLVRQDIKCLLVACNTASSYALGALQQQLEIPVVGVIEPAAQAAVKASPRGMIGVIGTLGTIGSAAYPHAIEQLTPGAHVISQACPMFVPLVEEGMLDHPATRLIAEEYLKELRSSSVESLILGCTHYPLLAPMIHELMGPAVTLIDSGAEAAHALARLLEKRGQLAMHAKPQHQFFLSDEPRHFRRVGQTFLGGELPPVHVVDQTDLPWFERTHPDWTQTARP